MGWSFVIDKSLEKAPPKLEHWRKRWWSKGL